jgi:hypothetical protein
MKILSVIPALLIFCAFTNIFFWVRYYNKISKVLRTCGVSEKVNDNLVIALSEFVFFIPFVGIRIQHSILYNLKPRLSEFTAYNEAVSYLQNKCISSFIFMLMYYLYSLWTAFMLIWMLPFKNIFSFL